MQNITLAFPNDRFALNDVSLTVNSKLSIYAVKSTFAIEEDTTDIPCVITDDSTTSKVMSLRVPGDVGESFTLTLKRSTVKKSENLHLSFGYTVQTPGGIVQCTVTQLECISEFK
jgi:hypothetical protein